MGLAASQGRLLSLTSRLSDLELKSQSISNQKMRLTNTSNAASTKYQQALMMDKITFNNGNKTILATAENLTEYNPNLTTQRILKTADGKPIVSSDVAAAFKAHPDNLNAYLAQFGLTNTSITEVPAEAKKALMAPAQAMGLQAQAAMDLLLQNQKAAAAESGNYETLSESLKWVKDNTTDKNSDNYKNASNAMKSIEYLDLITNDFDKSSFLSNLGATNSTESVKIVDQVEHSYDYTTKDYYGNDQTIKGNTATIQNIVQNNIKSLLGAENAGTGYYSEKLMNALTAGKADINPDALSTAIENTIGFYTTQIGTTRANSSYIGVSHNGDNADGGYSDRFAKLSSGYGNNSNINDALYEKGAVTNNLVCSANRTDDFFANKQQIYLTFLANYEAASRPSSVSSNSLAQSSNRTSGGGTTIGDVSEAQKNTNVQDVKNAISDSVSKVSLFDENAEGYDDVKLTDSNTIDSAFAAFQSKLSEYSGFFSSGSVLSSYLNDIITNIDASDKLDLKELNNLSLYANGIADELAKEGLSSQFKRGELNYDMSQVTYYTNLFNEMQNAGAGVELKPEMKSAEWLNNNLTSGNVYLSSKDLTTNTDSLSERINYKNDDLCINVELDNSFVAKAEAEYDATMREISTKEKRLDQDLQSVSTEMSSIQESMDSVKTNMTKNIDRSFKLFA